MGSRDKIIVEREGGVAKTRNKKLDWDEQRRLWNRLGFCARAACTRLHDYQRSQETRHLYCVSCSEKLAREQAPIQHIFHDVRPDRSVMELTRSEFFYWRPGMVSIGGLIINDTRENGKEAKVYEPSTGTFFWVPTSILVPDIMNPSMKGQLAFLLDSRYGHGCYVAQLVNSQEDGMCARRFDGTCILDQVSQTIEMAIVEALVAPDTAGGEPSDVLE